MAASMDIRLDYGVWPDDDGETTESAASREVSPPFDYTAGFPQSHISEREASSTLSLSDLFSDSDETVSTAYPSRGRMGAVPSTVAPRNSLQQHNQVAGGEDVNTGNTVNNSTFTSPIIDLTDSPPLSATRPTSSSWRISPLPESSSPQQSAMPPTLRTNIRSRRQAEASSPTSHQSQERPRKRRRISQPSITAERPQPTLREEPEIEAVDLTEVNDESELSKAISKQQQDAVQAQMKEIQGNDLTGRTRLSSYKCPICMDTPEDATTTICGQCYT
jgi:hypothetical protein